MKTFTICICFMLAIMVIIIVNVLLKSDEVKETELSEIKSSLSLSQYSDGKSSLHIPIEGRNNYYYYFRDTTGNGYADTKGEVIFNTNPAGFQTISEEKVTDTIDVKALYERLGKDQYYKEKNSL